MDITYEQSPKALILRPSGDINAASSPFLREMISEQYSGQGSIIVNLAEVHYMDSSGLATLVEGLQTARRGGGELLLCEIREQMIMDLLEITHLLKAFPIFDTETAALDNIE